MSCLLIEPDVFVLKLILIIIAITVVVEDLWALFLLLVSLLFLDLIDKGSDWGGFYIDDVEASEMAVVSNSEGIQNTLPSARLGDG